MQQAPTRTRGDVIRDYREFEQLSQSDLARRTGLSVRTISRLENSRGGDPMPQRATVRRLAHVFRVKAQDLYDELDSVRA